MKFLRDILKKIIPQSFVIYCRRKAPLVSWYLGGKTIPPPQEVKQYIIKKFADRSGIQTFVETGTCEGDTLRAVENKFNRIFSIELDQRMYENAKKEFASCPYIQILQGDSGEKLTEVMKEIKEPTLFWLDAHYSGGNTARAAIDTPIVKELRTILEHPQKKHIILIDDARCFNGTNSYPTLSDMRELIASYHHMSMSVSVDIIRIIPK